MSRTEPLPGVGGYDEAGINSADFSQGLCHEISIEANNADESTNPQTLLSSGYKQILHKDKIAGGASTASVGVLKSSGKLSAAKCVYDCMFRKRKG